MTKFRGFTIDTKQWVYGYYFQIGKDSYIMNNAGFSYYNIQIDPVGPKSPSALMPSITEEHFLQVSPESVGQFTGLHDKNGKELDWWEGDILRKNNGCLAEIVFRNGCFMGRWICRDDYLPFFYFKRSSQHPEWFEVIGNATEHPSLLKGEQE